MVGVVQLVGASSHNQKVEGLIPGQGIYLDCLLLLTAFSCALAGVAQWIECWPVNQRVTGSIPS